MIVKTRAVVLRETKFLDQSKICSLFTREFGKIAVILKGARNPKSRLSGKFSPGSVLDIVLYKKNNREVQLVSEGNVIHSPLDAEPDLERFAVMYRIVDIAGHALDGEEKNLPLFSLLEETLAVLFGNRNRLELLFPWFLLRLVSLLGFEPSVSHCVFCGKDVAQAAENMNLRDVLFVMNPGGIAIPAAAPGHTQTGRRISLEAFLLLRNLSSASLEKLDDFEAGEAETDLLSTLLQEYCALHLEHAPCSRNLAVVAQMRSK